MWNHRFEKNNKYLSCYHTIYGLLFGETSVIINQESSFDYPTESEMQKDKDGNMFIAGG